MRLSIAMMVKNESKYLEQCLESMRSIREAVQSELIIVDTGSEDNTVDIARKFTDKVYFHPWNNNFSEMRNITISYATGEWILIIDGDEVLQNTKGIISFLNSKERKKYGAALISAKNIISELDENNCSEMLSPRLFKRSRKFHYSGAVHNQPVFEGSAIALDADMIHYGYLSTDRDLMERKFKRTSELLKAELEKTPDSVYLCYQLSITYGMHGDYMERLEYGLKAYQVLHNDQKVLKNYMYVYTNLAFCYQKLDDYAKVEEICREALKVQEARKYIDIYFLMAESQLVLKKYEEAIKYYEAYFDILNNYNEYQKKRDTAVIDYTTKQSDPAYFNLFTSCKALGQDEKALAYGVKVKSEELVKGILPDFIALSVKLERYKELHQYYEEQIMNENEDLVGFFINTLEDYKCKLEDSEIDKMVKIAKLFAVGDDENSTAVQYSLLNRVIVEEQLGEFSEETLHDIKQVDFAEWPVFCNEIFYYLLRKSYPLTNMLDNFNEILLSNAFDYLVQRHSDLSILIFKYLEKEESNEGVENVNEYKVSKTLCRYALLLDQLNDDDYLRVFTRYIDAGVAYLKLIYMNDILEQELIYELKNDEEIFYLYMYKAQVFQETDQTGYLQHLRKALIVMPGMKRGVDILLQQFEQEKVSKEQKELKQVQQMIKNKITEFIEAGDFRHALYLISEYETVQIHDSEIESMKAVIAMAEQRWGDAKSILQNALARDGENFDLWYNLAYLSEAQGDLMNARTIYSNLRLENNEPKKVDILQEALERLDAHPYKNSNIIDQQTSSITAIPDQRESRQNIAVSIMSDTLILSDNYPSELSKYGNMFVHTRIKQYQKRGLNPLVFVYRSDNNRVDREFEGVTIIEAGGEVLQEILNSGKIKLVMVHFLLIPYWQILFPRLGKIKLIVYCHGYEIQPWYRRVFNYRPEDIDRQKQISEVVLRFWHSVFTTALNGSSIHFVFVSQYFADEVMEDHRITLPSEKYSVIHNAIDTDLFQYIEKGIEQRKRVLSLGSYGSPKYGRDIALTAVLELAKHKEFKNMEFYFAGSGVLWDKLTQPLRKHKNIKLDNRILTHREITELQKEYGVYLMMTRWDSQGVSRDEAMSSGLVPVTNAVAAIPEFVDDDCGILCPAEDPVAAAEALLRLYHEPELFQRLSRNAAARVRRQTAADIVIGKEMALFERMKALTSG